MHRVENRPESSLMPLPNVAASDASLHGPARGPSERWYRDERFVAGLPWSYRIFARYCSRMADFRRGRILFEYPLFRFIGQARKRLRLPTGAPLTAGDVVVVVELSDPRAALVYRELAGPSSMAQLLRRLLRPGDTFIDVGANHGSYSLLAARIVGPTGRVIAFEPQQRLTGHLARSLAANDLHNCRIFECGLSDSRRHATLYVPDINSGSASIFRGYVRRAAHTSLDVPLERLDDLPLNVPRGTHTIMKLDIEGSERDCLLGARRFLTEHKPDLIVEINRRAAEAAGHTVAELMALLRSYGYARFAEIERFMETGRTETNPAFTRECNILALPDDADPVH
jgi:FkbM family methyltransferase